MVIIYSGDLPNDWCLVPVEKKKNKGTDFQVGCMFLHLLDSSISSPTKWLNCDLINGKNKKRPFNTDATLGILPEKIIYSYFCVRAKASPQTNLDVGGQRHFLKALSRLQAKCMHIPDIPLFFQLERMVWSKRRAKALVLSSRSVAWVM